MRVIIVDDQILFRECLVKAIGSQPDFTIVGQTGSSNEGIALALNQRADLVLLGADSSQINTMEVIEKILSRRPETKIVILSFSASDDSLFAAIRHGAKGFITKDIPLDHLIASLRALKRDEVALSRTMTSRILDEFTRLGKVVNGENLQGLKMLTSREIEILDHLGRDASNTEIAERLLISHNTVKVHISHILEKLNLRNRHEAGRFARRHGVINGHDNT